MLFTIVLAFTLSSSPKRLKIIRWIKPIWKNGDQREHISVYSLRRATNVGYRQLLMRDVYKMYVLTFKGNSTMFSQWAYSNFLWPMPEASPHNWVISDSTVDSIKNDCFSPCHSLGVQNVGIIFHYFYIWILFVIGSYLEYFETKAEPLRDNFFASYWIFLGSAFLVQTSSNTNRVHLSGAAS